MTTILARNILASMTGTDVSNLIVQEFLFDVENLAQYDKWAIRKFLNRATQTTRSALLDTACETGNVENVKALLADGRADPDDSACLVSASVLGHTEIVKALLADGRADPRAGDNACLFLACKSGHTEIVKALLADGRADLSAQNSGCLFWACKRGHTEVVRVLSSDPRMNSGSSRKRRRIS